MIQSEVTSISDLIAALERDHANYSGDVWFRGHARKAWKLAPGYLRLSNPPSESTLLKRFKQSAAMLLDRDPVLYYLLCKSAVENDVAALLSRERLYAFRDQVRDNRNRAEENYADASFELLEFDRLSQQGTNDSSNIRERLSVISRFMNIPLISI